jgi:hypothetical protein
MIELFSVPTRNYNNRNFDTTRLLSSLVDVQACGGLLLRLEIISITGQITISYEIRNGNTYEGGAVHTVSQVGKHQIGFGRGDFDSSTTITVSIVLSGNARLGAILYSVAQGEDVLEWL